MPEAVPGYEVVVLEYETGVLVTLAEVLVLDIFMALAVLVRVGSTGVETLAELVYVGLEYDVGHVRVRL